MDEHQGMTDSSGTTADDRLWAALSWIPISPLWPLLAVLALVMDTTKNRAFVRYNAVLSLVTGIALIPVAIVTFGLGALLYLVFFYWAYQAYQGQQVAVPFASDWVKKQGWVS